MSSFIKVKNVMTGFLDQQYHLYDCCDPDARNFFTCDLTNGNICQNIGNDCWGYTSGNGIRYALTGHVDRLRIYRIRNDRLNLVTQIKHSPSNWADVKVYNDHCYCVNESGGGIQIISLANIDNQPDYPSTSIPGVAYPYGLPPTASTSAIANAEPFQQPFANITEVKLNNQTTSRCQTCHNVYVDEENGILYALGVGPDYIANNVTINSGPSTFTPGAAHDPNNELIYVQGNVVNSSNSTSQPSFKLTHTHGKSMPGMLPISGKTLTFALKQLDDIPGANTIGNISLNTWTANASPSNPIFIPLVGGNFNSGPANMANMAMPNMMGNTMLNMMGHSHGMPNSTANLYEITKLYIYKQNEINWQGNLDFTVNVLPSFNFILPVNEYLSINSQNFSDAANIANTSVANINNFEVGFKYWKHYMPANISSIPPDTLPDVNAWPHSNNYGYYANLIIANPSVNNKLPYQTIGKAINDNILSTSIDGDNTPPTHVEGFGHMHVHLNDGSTADNVLLSSGKLGRYYGIPFTIDSTQYDTDKVYKLSLALYTNDHRIYTYNNKKIETTYLIKVMTNNGNGIEEGVKVSLYYSWDWPGPAAGQPFKNFNLMYFHDFVTYTYTINGKKRIIGYGSGEDNGIYVIDVTTAHDWKLITFLSDYKQVIKKSNFVGNKTQSYMHQIWPSSDGRYIFANDEFLNKNFVIVYDMKPTLDTLDDPITLHPVLKTWNGENWTNGMLTMNHNLYVHYIEDLCCDVIFHSCYTTGLRLYEVVRDDANNKIDLYEIGSFDSYPQSDGQFYNGQWSNYFWNDGSGYALLSDKDNGDILIKIQWVTNKNNPCICRDPYLSIQQRKDILSYSYQNTKRNSVVWTSPSTYKIVTVGYRAPIQITNGDGYQRPLRLSGTDGWGATLAQPTMDHLFGSGLSTGINGFSARNGYCRSTNCTGCKKDCQRTNQAPSTEIDPVLGTIVTGKYNYMSLIKQKFSINGLYCDGCIKNSSTDPSFINHDNSFMKAPPLLNQ